MKTVIIIIIVIVIILIYLISYNLNTETFVVNDLVSIINPANNLSFSTCGTKNNLCLNAIPEKFSILPEGSKVSFRSLKTGFYIDSDTLNVNSFQGLIPNCQFTLIPVPNKKDTYLIQTHNSEYITIDKLRYIIKSKFSQEFIIKIEI